ncbi:SipW-dependent-type signal peptide-containing protein [Dietzia sp. ANT_WB102]|uniref:SipW-dependent-type signal peptide-containing protein n=1 Tax=Dietzia sp. ANT_WB102 TaxID=2597345 RepID=UPI0011EE1BBD|nr:SipW-dependent-type signal peptide-containing protein [Dietzia sp. ANT_WB102]KAA0918764.1 hypothetical protein FQ137_05425 [Dietzia sp. ANT_WB102]
MTDSMNPSELADRNRKRKALLAGGVVLGLGAVATLAAFTDDVFATGTFSSAKFSIQGSQAAAYPAASDASFKDYPDPTGAPGTGHAALTFASSMAPGDTVYAPFTIRTGPESGAGTVTLAGAYFSTAGTLDPYLTYTVLNGGTTCAAGASTTNGTSWATGTPGGTQSSPTAPTGAPARDLLADSGDTQKFCIAVTLANSQAAKDAINNANPLTSTSITWDFRGTATT